MASLPPELVQLQHRVEKYARELQLDFFDVIFEMLDWNELNMVAAYGGFPNRYPHWRYGIEYELISKYYSYGLSKIYEMVINNDPCYAYLLHSNAFVDQKLVMAHVYAHCDFFKNNVYFGNTNRKMMDEMANHRTRVMRLIDRLGVEEVEGFVDSCLSLENLIDFHLVKQKPKKEKEEDSVKRFQSKSYMDKYINPKEFLEEQEKRLKEKLASGDKVPTRPEKDVLGFLLDYAPLEDWEHQVLSIIRKEVYYFAQQGQTKIMNEGWASFWHSKMMTERLLTAEEVIDYADHHSGTLAARPGQLNPYKLGIELFRDVEERWNRGQFGKDFEECDNLVVKRQWDKKLGEGRKKIFEVRKLYNDITFIDEFLTPEFCDKHKLFVFAYNITADQYEIATREFEKIKKQLLFQLTNMGNPLIYATEANYRGRGELLLKHHHEGMDLKMDWAQETLKALYRVWKKPVHVDTLVSGVPKILSFDGKEYQESRP